jgi:NAD+ diphosphatase
MPDSLAFIFKSSSLLVPESMSDSDAVRGFDPDADLLAPYNCGKPFQDYPDVHGTGKFRVYDHPQDEALPAGWRELSIRSALGAATVAGGPEFRVGNLFRSYHLHQWKTDSAFCGRCGTANVFAEDELARLCPACGRREYPRISPAVIILTTRDDGRALLAHNVKFREGIYSLVAGFVEAGENIEEAAEREILEETGIEVEDIRYAASQSWPFPNSLMIGLRARYKSGELRPDMVEIVDADWFAPDALPEIPAPGSVSRSLIDAWLREGAGS